MLDRLHTKGGADMRFARTGTADQHHIVGTVDELAAMQLANHGFVDLAGCKVEAGQVLVGRKPGSLDLVGDGADLALGHFCLEQLGNDRHSCIEGWRPLFDQVADSLGHAVHLERPQHHDARDAMGAALAGS